MFDKSQQKKHLFFDILSHYKRLFRDTENESEGEGEGVDNIIEVIVTVTSIFS